MKKKVLTLVICLLVCLNFFGCSSNIIAGTDTDVVRDGTPKKYFTLSCDDGITQDARIIEILKKYNAKATFFINSGLLGSDWSDWVSEMVGTDVTHKRWTKDEIKTGIYDGMDVACHTYSHPTMKDISKVKRAREVNKDIKNITDLTGIQPIGMAWPGGDPAINESCIETVLEKTSVRFARCTTSTGNFELPERFLKWYPTASVVDSNILDLADEFVKANPNEDMLFYVWMHGYELDCFEAWDTFETLIKTISESEDIIIVTNSEFYQLFSSEIPS